MIFGAGVVGMVLGFVGATLRARYDTRVRRPADVGAALRASVLAAVPREPVDEPAVVASPASRRAAAYRTLHSEVTAALHRLNGDGSLRFSGAQVIAVLPASSNDSADLAAPLVAANIAALLAAGGEPVALLGRARKPAAAQILGADAPSAVVDERELQPLPEAGALETVADSVERQRDAGRLVLFELDPADHPSAQAIAAVADLVIVACSLPTQLTRHDLARARADLDRVGCRAVVAVVVADDRRSSAKRAPFGRANAAPALADAPPSGVLR